MPRGQHPSVYDPEWYLLGASTFYRQTIDPSLAASDVAAALTTQVMLSAAIFLEVGDRITSISTTSGNTAAGTPTNYWFALYYDSATPALMAQTADQLTAAWAANTVKTFALQTVQVIPRTGIYYIGIMVKATTVPSLVCRVAGRDVMNGALLSGY